MALSRRVPEPIFKVKKDADVFELYGSGKIVDDTNVKDAGDVDGVSNDLQSMRIRLAVMKAKEQCEEEDGNEIRHEAIDEIDSNLREIIALESPGVNGTGLKSSNKKESGRQQKVSRNETNPKLLKEEKSKVISQINSQLDGITSMYSKIFQALIVLINEHHLNEQASRSLNEVEKINKRSREFDVRLHRQIFEAKQKTLVLKATMVKYQLHNNQKTRFLANKALYQSLRCYSSILGAYLSHLPLCGRQIFPSSLHSLFEILGTVAYHANDLTFDKAQQMISDTHRLSAVYYQFHSKFHRNNDDYTSKSPAAEMFGSAKNLEIIDSLAQERFGTPPPAIDLTSLRSPRRKSNIKRDTMMKSNQVEKSPRTFSGLNKKPKQIIPKPTKLLQDRVKFSKGKWYGENLITDITQKELEMKEKSGVDDILIKVAGDTQDQQFSYHSNPPSNEHERRLSHISISSQSHLSNIDVDIGQKILSIRSPRLPEDKKLEKSSSKNDPSSFEFHQTSIHDDASNEIQNNNIPTPPTKSQNASSRRKSSIKNGVKREPTNRSISRQSTLFSSKDEDYSINIDKQRLKGYKDTSVYNDDVEDRDLVKDEALTRNRIRNAGFGNMLSFATEDKLRALDKFNTPNINDRVFMIFPPREGKKYIDISKDELDHIISYKENFEHDLARIHFTNKVKDGKPYLQKENPFKFINSISQKVTDEIIENVCHEMLTSDIVADLIQKELRN